ncbi:[acyl-carrier-protein] S-malonyltransferase [Herbihabitans rhizosphaerae]|uniref:[acyl-carrier-protein] S-malonyltransferase n=1 Tax=Herbihabitans rhizosphaerae TaxID=1872711 RepID=A0A4Q7KDS9_9PSEU|nr:hypothetical protein [Herbihabitans rhizosphaerae]RZS32375.1 [acyl-carrier-protein] S-malonyltransferase [Herbihabitans rhizosphaerae]
MPHGDDHQHVPPSAKAAAARAQRDATVIGWVDGDPVSRTLLEARLTALRSSPSAGSLPALGTSEDRQLVRWTAHVLFTEEICRREALARHLIAERPAPLDPISAVQLGSINTAAWHARPEVSAVFDDAFPGTPTKTVPRPTTRWWRVSHASAPSEEDADQAPLRPIGWTTLNDLPPALAAALRAADPGRRVGPVLAADTWHAAVADETADRPSTVDTCPSGLGERLREFARWLDRRRGESVRPAKGFEHPGDPSQPDNTHRH